MSSGGPSDEHAGEPGRKTCERKRPFPRRVNQGVGIGSEPCSRYAVPTIGRTGRAERSQEERMSIHRSRRRFLKHGAVVGSGLVLPMLGMHSIHAADPVRMRAIWWGGQ